MIKDYLKELICHHFEHIPTPDQEKVIDSLSEFILSPEADSVYILRGFAGTGKTSLVSALVKTLEQLERECVLMAPTGRAAKVFSFYSEHPAFTIHKRIYRQKSIDKDSIFTLNYNMRQNLLFICDEASMIANDEYLSGSLYGTGRLLDDLVHFVYGGKGCRLILMGDTAQLPPVGDDESPALNDNYMGGYGLQIISHTLTEVVRQTDSSGILWNATHLRQLLEDEELFEDLFEQIGYILYARQHNNPHFTMLVGESGSNGKSIILNVLTKIIQSPNIASLSMYEMSNEFQLATACGKYLCMSHDTTNGLRDKSTATADAKEFIKKATAREPFTFNAKYREPFLGYGPSKFIFASNSQINFGGGADNGLERRMTVIPFYAKFKEDQKVAAEFYTPEALEWFAMQALVSYMCYIHRAYEGTDESEFTPNTPLKGIFMKSTKAMLAKKEQMKAQNTLLDWISSYHDCDIDDVSTVRRIFTDSYDIYNDYCQFCRLSNRAPMTLNKFNREVKNRYNMQRRRTTKGTDHIYVYEIAGTSPYDYEETI